MKCLTTLSQYLTKGRGPDEREVHGVDFAFQEDENAAQLLAEQARLAVIGPLDNADVRRRAMPMHAAPSANQPAPEQGRADRDANWRAPGEG